MVFQAPGYPRRSAANDAIIVARGPTGLFLAGAWERGRKPTQGSLATQISRNDRTPHPRGPHPGTAGSTDRSTTDHTDHTDGRRDGRRLRFLLICVICAICGSPLCGIPEAARVAYGFFFLAPPTRGSFGGEMFSAFATLLPGTSLKLTMTRPPTCRSLSAPFPPRPRIVPG